MRHMLDLRRRSVRVGVRLLLQFGKQRGRAMDRTISGCDRRKLQALKHELGMPTNTATVNAGLDAGLILAKGSAGDLRLFSAAKLAEMMRLKTFKATVENVRIALTTLEPGAFEVIGDAETCDLEIRRVDSEGSKTVIIKASPTATPVGAN